MSWTSAFDFKINPKDVVENESQEFDFSIFKGKPFYCWDKNLFGLHDCCFSHIVGLPTGRFDDKEKPWWDHHKITIDRMTDDNYHDSKKRRHIRVKKATGLAFSEFGIYYMCYLALRNNDYMNKQMCIITGPNLDLATKLIRRIRTVFNRHHNVDLHGKETRIVLNGCEIQAYPAGNLSSYRSLTNPKFILLDEADFFGEKKKDDMWEVRYVTERYIGKSNPYILMISTPNRPGFLYEIMDNEDQENSLYQLLEFNWEWGVPPKADIFTWDFINNNRNSFTFEREYNLKYLGEVGNVFSEIKIKRAIELGAFYDFPDQNVKGGRGFPLNRYTHHFVGIDPGFGSSRSAVTVLEWMEEYQMLRVIYHNEFDRANPEKIADMVFSFNRLYGNCWYYVDGANRGFVTELKVRFGEDTEWEKEDIDENVVKVIPVNFATHHKELLAHLHVLVNKELIAIPERFNFITTAMSTAIAKEYQLDKTKTSYDDSLDSLRLAAFGLRAKNQ